MLNTLQWKSEEMFQMCLFRINKISKNMNKILKKLPTKFKKSSDLKNDIFQNRHCRNNQTGC